MWKYILVCYVHIEGCLKNYNGALWTTQCLNVSAILLFKQNDDPKQET